MVVIIRCRLGRFDLNPLGLQLFLLGNADFENPVAVNGRDGRCISGAMQSEATVKGPGPALDLAIAFLLIALGCPRALNRQNPVFQRDFNVFGGHARKIRVDDVALILFLDICRRQPVADSVSVSKTSETPRRIGGLGPHRAS